MQHELTLTLSSKGCAADEGSSEAEQNERNSSTWCVFSWAEGFKRGVLKCMYFLHSDLFLLTYPCIGQGPEMVDKNGAMRGSFELK